MPFQWLSPSDATRCPSRAGLWDGLTAVVLAAWILFSPPLTGAQTASCEDSCLEERQARVAGDWYVLIHFEDPKAEENPGLQWDDQIWRIERAGSKLRWTIFPHVELENAQGRYHETPDGLMARSLGAWSPDPEQWKEIRAGVETDPYSARSKTLRASGSGEWKSSGRLRSGSASMVGYHELWEIRFDEGEPVFVRIDSMGSGRTDVLSGQTRYAVESQGPVKSEMRGVYRRGEQTEGRFTMVRMGEGAGSGS